MGKRAAHAETGIDSSCARELPVKGAGPVLVTIAGFDPSSGAGITADLQTFWNHGCDGVSAITALTVQSALGVASVEPLSGDRLRRTLDCLAAELPLAGVKIGMLGTAEAVDVVMAFLRRAGVGRERVVLDPVLRSSSGAALLEARGVEKLRADLLPEVGWVTPNLDELGALTGRTVAGRGAIPDQAQLLQELVPSGLNVVVTGGHLNPPDDFLLTAEGRRTWFSGERIAARGIHGEHGTGCAFSSALLCRLVMGDAAEDAVRAAKAWVAARLAGRG
jgi:hydroxymethylpyrimidine/phosphomethylpyrimidine kinase